MKDEKRVCRTLLQIEKNCETDLCKGCTKKRLSVCKEIKEKIVEAKEILEEEKK